MRSIEDIYSVILLYSVWIIVTGDLSSDSLILGLLVSSTILFFIQSSFTRKLSKKIITRSIFFIGYILLLALEVFIASYKVAYLVLHPKLPFKSAIVKLPTKVGKKDRLIKASLLANTVTLTPGTITIDLDNQTQELYIHWISIKSEDTNEIRKIIFGRFERMIRRLFG